MTTIPYNKFCEKLTNDENITSVGCGSQIKSTKDRCCPDQCSNPARYDLLIKCPCSESSLYRYCIEHTAAVRQICNEQQCYACKLPYELVQVTDLFQSDRKRRNNEEDH